MAAELPWHLQSVKIKSFFGAVDQLRARAIRQSKIGELASIMEDLKQRKISDLSDHDGIVNGFSSQRIETAHDFLILTNQAMQRAFDIAKTNGATIQDAEAFAENAMKLLEKHGITPHGYTM